MANSSYQDAINNYKMNTDLTDTGSTSSAAAPSVSAPTGGTSQSTGGSTKGIPQIVVKNSNEDLNQGGTEDYKQRLRSIKLDTDLSGDGGGGQAPTSGDQSQSLMSQATGGVKSLMDWAGGGDGGLSWQSSTNEGASGQPVGASNPQLSSKIRFDPNPSPALTKFITPEPFRKYLPNTEVEVDSSKVYSTIKDAIGNAVGFLKNNLGTTSVPIAPLANKLAQSVLQTPNGVDKMALAHAASSVTAKYGLLAPSSGDSSYAKGGIIDKVSSGLANALTNDLLTLNQWEDATDNVIYKKSIAPNQVARLADSARSEVFATHLKDSVTNPVGHMAMSLVNNPVTTVAVAGTLGVAAIDGALTVGNAYLTAARTGTWAAANAVARTSAVNGAKYAGGLGLNIGTAYIGGMTARATLLDTLLQRTNVDTKDPNYKQTPGYQSAEELATAAGENIGGPGIELGAKATGQLAKWKLYKKPLQNLFDNLTNHVADAIKTATKSPKDDLEIFNAIKSSPEGLQPTSDHVVSTVREAAQATPSFSGQVTDLKSARDFVTYLTNSNGKYSEKLIGLRSKLAPPTDSTPEASQINQMTTDAVHTIMQHAAKTGGSATPNQELGAGRNEVYNVLPDQAQKELNNLGVVRGYFGQLTHNFFDGPLDVAGYLEKARVNPPMLSNIGGLANMVGATAEGKKAVNELIEATHSFNSIYRSPHPTRDAITYVEPGTDTATFKGIAGKKAAVEIAAQYAPEMLSVLHPDSKWSGIRNTMSQGNTAVKITNNGVSNVVSNEYYDRATIGLSSDLPIPEKGMMRYNINKTTKPEQRQQIGEFLLNDAIPLSAVNASVNGIHLLSTNGTSGARVARNSVDTLTSRQSENLSKANMTALGLFDPNSSDPATDYALKLLKHVEGEHVSGALAKANELGAGRGVNLDGIKRSVVRDLFHATLGEDGYNLDFDKLGLPVVSRVGKDGAVEPPMPSLSSISQPTKGSIDDVVDALNISQPHTSGSAFVKPNSATPHTGFGDVLYHAVSPDRVQELRDHLFDAGTQEVPSALRRSFNRLVYEHNGELSQGGQQLMDSFHGMLKSYKGDNPEVKAHLKKLASKDSPTVNDIFGHQTTNPEYQKIWSKMFGDASQETLGHLSGDSRTEFADAFDRFMRTPNGLAKRTDINKSMNLSNGKTDGQSNQQGFSPNHVHLTNLKQDNMHIDDAIENAIKLGNGGSDSKMLQMVKIGLGEIRDHFMFSTEAEKNLKVVRDAAHTAQFDLSGKLQALIGSDHELPNEVMSKSKVLMKIQDWIKKTDPVEVSQKIAELKQAYKSAIEKSNEYVKVVDSHFSPKDDPVAAKVNDAYSDELSRHISTAGDFFNAASEGRTLTKKQRDAEAPNEEHMPFMSMNKAELPVTGDLSLLDDHIASTSKSMEMFNKQLDLSVAIGTASEKQAALAQKVLASIKQDVGELHKVTLDSDGKPKSTKSAIGEFLTRFNVNQQSMLDSVKDGKFDGVWFRKDNQGVFQLAKDDIMGMYNHDLETVLLELHKKHGDSLNDSHVEAGFNSAIDKWSKITQMYDAHLGAGSDVTDNIKGVAVANLAYMANSPRNLVADFKRFKADRAVTTDQIGALMQKVKDHAITPGAKLANDFIEGKGETTRVAADWGKSFGSFIDQLDEHLDASNYKPTSEDVAKILNSGSSHNEVRGTVDPLTRHMRLGGLANSPSGNSPSGIIAKAINFGKGSMSLLGYMTFEGMRQSIQKTIQQAINHSGDKQGLQRVKDILSNPKFDYNDKIRLLSGVDDTLAMKLTKRDPDVATADLRAFTNLVKNIKSQSYDNLMSDIIQQQAVYNAVKEMTKKKQQ